MRCRVFFFFLLFLISTQLKAADKPSYRGLMRIPVELLTPEGTRLEKGQYDLEVKPENNDYVLLFSSAGQVKAVVKPLSDPNSELASARIPLVGTHYLRSSADPVLTGEERRFSKTGATQYEEENRDWKATLRVYKSSVDGMVYFLFEVRGERGSWSRKVFKLTSKENSQGR